MVAATMEASRWLDDLNNRAEAAQIIGDGLARDIATKLCLEALQDLVALAGESGGACPSSPRMFGRPCRRVCGGRLPPTLPQSSGS